MYSWLPMSHQPQRETLFPMVRLKILTKILILRVIIIVGEEETQTSIPAETQESPEVMPSRIMPKLFGTTTKI